MLTARKRVAMAAIDFDSLVESEENHEAVEFDIMLTESPDQKWIEEFDLAYRNTPNDIKPPARISGDRLRIGYLPRYDFELQNYIEFLKTVMNKADEEVEATEAIARRGDRPARIDAFRETLKHVRVGAG